MLFVKGFRNSCYADKINQMTVNYDGGVYKCTARDFNEKNRLGQLCDDGTVLWDKMHPGKDMNPNSPIPAVTDAESRHYVAEDAHRCHLTDLIPEVVQWVILNR